jgi:putative ABC transport system substrate-binding protein
MGLVDSLNRPGGNATGISTQNAELSAKKLGLLRELLPHITTIYALVSPANPSAEIISGALQVTARNLGMELRVLQADTVARSKQPSRASDKHPVAR